jgi:hypothetical protein
MEGLMWGILPMSCAIIALLLLLLLPERERVVAADYSGPAGEQLYAREAH